MNERVKQVRKNLGLTQQAFAEKLHVARNYITLIETGATPATDKFLYNVEATFGVDGNWLRTGEGEMYKALDREDEAAKIVDQYLNEVEPSIRNALHRIIADASEEELELILGCAQKLVDEMKEPPAN